MVGTGIMGIIMAITTMGTIMETGTMADTGTMVDTFPITMCHGTCTSHTLFIGRTAITRIRPRACILAGGISVSGSAGFKAD
jgi:hypothetical protein